MTEFPTNRRNLLRTAGAIVFGAEISAQANGREHNEIGETDIVITEGFNIAGSYPLNQREIITSAGGMYGPSGISLPSDAGESDERFAPIAAGQHVGLSGVPVQDDGYQWASSIIGFQEDLPSQTVIISFSAEESSPIIIEYSDILEYGLHLAGVAAEDIVNISPSEFSININNSSGQIVINFDENAIGPESPTIQFSFILEAINPVDGISVEKANDIDYDAGYTIVTPSGDQARDSFVVFEVGTTAISHVDTNNTNNGFVGEPADSTSLASLINTDGAADGTSNDGSFLVWQGQMVTFETATIGSRVDIYNPAVDENGNWALGSKIADAQVGFEDASPGVVVNLDTGSLTAGQRYFVTFGQDQSNAVVLDVRPLNLEYTADTDDLFENPDEPFSIEITSEDTTGAEVEVWFHHHQDRDISDVVHVERAKLTGNGNRTVEIIPAIDLSGPGEYTITLLHTESGVTEVPAFFEVTIESATQQIVDEAIDVTIIVKNTGKGSDTQTVKLSAPGLGSDSVEVDLDGGSSTTEELSLPTGDGDAGEYTVTVETGNSSDSANVTVLAPAAFTVDITGTNNPVAGGPLNVTVAVENTGDETGTQTVELSAPGFGSDSVEVDLDGGSSTTEELSLSTGEGDAGEYTVTVETGNSSDSADVTVLAPAAFTVDIEDTNNPVAGDPLDVTVTVENTGDGADTQTVELSAPGLGSDSVEVEELDGGESTTETLSLSTGEGDAGEYTVTAQAEDDEATETVTVSEPAGDGSTGSPDDGSETDDDGSTSGDDSTDPTGDGSDSGDESTSGDDSTDSTGDGSDSGDESTSGDDSTDSTSDGASTGDGGLGTTEVAAIGGGGGLALLLGAYALMRRSDDGSDSTSESTSNASTGGESSRQLSLSPSPSPGPDRGATHQRSRSDAGGVPSRIPDTPRPSLSYEDITIGDPLGRGGNADVYYATAATPQGDLELAVKEPRMGGGETLHTEVVERMMQEAETWQQLDDHDHVAGVVDYGAQPLPWIAMEYMDASHLGERAGEMDTAQKLWTALSVTEGVYHAHNRGIAHRDLKPENILFRRVDGAWDVPKVADWGLSKHLLEHSKSRDGMTVEYAAPEQFSDSASTDDRTDIYQLGAVFYELFTGQPPFEGEMFAVMKQIENERPTPPSEIADVPDGLDEVLLRALAKKPNDRYSDIVYLRDDLQELHSSV